MFYEWGKEYYENVKNWNCKKLRYYTNFGFRGLFFLTLFFGLCILWSIMQELICVWIYKFRRGRSLTDVYGAETVIRRVSAACQKSLPLPEPIRSRSPYICKRCGGYRNPADTESDTEYESIYVPPRPACCNLRCYGRYRRRDSSDYASSQSSDTKQSALAFTTKGINHLSASDTHCKFCRSSEKV